METIRQEVIDQLDDKERKALDNLLRLSPPADPYVDLKKRPFIQKRTVENLLPGIEGSQGKGDRKRGKKVFSAALCFRCHRIAGEGGMVGPDLTGIAGRFNVRDLVEAIVEPSRVVPDQYRMSVLTLKDGRTIQGKIKDVSGNKLLVLRDPVKPADLLMIERDTVEEIAWSNVSMMPEGLLDTFTREEILDLFAFLKAPSKDPGSTARPQR
jgi:putative heme-binding domain-containing protein